MGEGNVFYKRFIALVCSFHFYSAFPAFSWDYLETFMEESLPFQKLMGASQGRAPCFIRHYIHSTQLSVWNTDVLNKYSLN